MNGTARSSQYGSGGFDSTPWEILSLILSLPAQQEAGARCSDGGISALGLGPREQ